MTVSGNPTPLNEPLPPGHEKASANKIEPVSSTDGEEAQVSSELENDALDQVTDLTGQTVAHFRVQERLGGGAMGSVYRAVDMRTNHTVALKLLLPGADVVTRERFRREARTASMLKHPHIIRTHQVGQSAATGVIYIAMELVEGHSLASLLERQGRLTQRDACNLLKPIAEALAYAHEHGVIHRDVKPSNILLRRADAESSGQVRLSVLDYPVVPLLSDFGIARALDAPELTSAGRTIGTPAFMAPEQCAGTGDIDGRADIYSLGAVFYRCLVGRPPFGGSTTQILHAHVYDAVLIPDETARRLSPAVLGVLTRSMAKEPARRFWSMGDFAAELDRCIAALAHAPGPANLDDLGDSTRTMATLPATPLPGAATSRILVPAAPATPRSVGVVPLRPAPPATAVHPVNPPAARRSPRRISGNQTGVMILAAALVMLSLLLGITLFSGTLADMVGRNAVVGSSLAEGTEVASQDEAAATPATTPAVTPEVSPDREQAQSGLAVLASPEPTRAPSALPTPAPRPAVSLASAWDDALVFFKERDWEAALDWLTMVRRIDREYEREQVDAMLMTTYLGLATQATVAGDLDGALSFLDEALALDPGSALVNEMHASTAALAEAQTGERSAARAALQRTHVEYAASLFDDDPCAAAEHLDAAIRILSDPTLIERAEAYRAACTGEQSAEVLGDLGGRIIYSAQESGVYRIFALPVGQDAPSTLLVDNASQPSLSPDGRSLAFFSTRPDAQGLYGIDLYGGQGVDDRSLRYATAPEDARDAPARWNAQGNRLAFTSTRFGDGRYRVYLTWADGGEAVDTLGYGKDPAWHPYQELLVYNGTDETGNAPGLWLTRLDGSGRMRLTDNGNDQRPTWSPDGSYVVFMSNGRDGNWELYRVNLADLSIVRLTNHPAQDGLPAISPDGRYVAFMSDRDGYWRLWYVSVDGGEAQPLGTISGELPKWLEHAIQWVR